MRTLQRACLMLGVAAGTVCVASVASAELRMNLRATTVNGVPIAGAQTQHFIPNAIVGDVIGFDVYGVVYGADSNFQNDRFVSASGSFHSTTSVPALPLLGNLLLDVVRTQIDPKTGEQIGPAGFDNLGFSVGTQQDLDADGDLDVGSNNFGNVVHHWPLARMERRQARGPLPAFRMAAK